MGGRDERVVMELTHASAVYEGRGLLHPFGPYLPVYPRQAVGALREVWPWEAFVGAGLVYGILRVSLDSSTARELAACALLALVTLQMIGSRTYLTDDGIVWRRAFGPVTFRWKRLALAGIRGTRVDRTEANQPFGDLVLETEDGEVRVRALHHPEAVRERVMELKRLWEVRGGGPTRR